MRRGEDGTRTIYMREGVVDCSVVDRGMDEDVGTSERPDRIGISVPQVRWSFVRNVAVEREPEQNWSQGNRPNQAQAAGIGLVGFQ